jgi:pimeloyl-ACP methyl ester carboxylesterase
MEDQKPKTPLHLIYGELDEFKPNAKWAKNLGIDLTVVPNFGHHLYSDEKIISQVSLGLLELATKKAV